jgi:hypothetical protein
MARQKKPGKSNKRKSKKTEPEIEKNTKSDTNVSCSCCRFQNTSYTNHRI